MQKQDQRRSPFEAQNYVVEGLAAVSEYLRFRPDAVREILVVPAARRNVEQLLEQIWKQHSVTLSKPVIRELNRSTAERTQATKHADKGINRPSPKPKFQAKSAQAKPAEPASGREFVSQAPVQARVILQAIPADAGFARLKQRTRDLVLMLDHTTDPRNLGAIVRTAAFFGVREVFLAERRQVQITQAAVSTAQGGFALVDVVCVVNLHRTLDELKERGYWVIGADMQGEAVQSLAGVYDKVVLVLGNEETGMSQNVREQCDRMAAILPPQRGVATLESLNVSVAAGIMLASLSTTKA